MPSACRETRFSFIPSTLALLPILRQCYVER
jgi:hypothetical protein